MCTVVLSLYPEAAWPVIIGANRDEMAGRPWAGPARHWPDRNDVIGGLDTLAGGSWMAVNDWGVTALILNRYGTLGPMAGKRSRGELVLDALDHADAKDAAQALRDLDGRAYRAFNMIVADNSGAFWVRADGGARVAVTPIAPGVHMITAGELDDDSSQRIARNLSLFRDCPRPDPDRGDWSRWPALLGTTGPEGDRGAMSFQSATGFGTRSSALLALPGAESSGVKPVWLFAAGPPEHTPFVPVDLTP